MRVSSVSLASAQRIDLQKQRKAVNHQEIPSSQRETIAFKRLKFGDYLAGGICGTVFGIVATAALGPIAGIAAGLFVAKTSAEANNETRPYDPDEDKHS